MPRPPVVIPSVPPRTAAAPRLLVLIGALLMSALPGPACGLDLRGTYWALAGARAGVPAELLYAVALLESSTLLQGGGTAPWPWTLNHGGVGYYYASARLAGRSWLIAGRLLDS